MSPFRRLGAAFVFAATFAGGVLISQPAYAGLPGPACARFAAAVEVLTKLAAEHPDNPLIAAFLERATEAYKNFCS